MATAEVLDDLDWNLAECLKYPDLDWFPTHTQRDKIKVCLKVCRVCPLRWECLTQAYKRGETSGIWGGSHAKDIPMFMALVAGATQSDSEQIILEKIYEKVY